MAARSLIVDASTGTVVVSSRQPQLIGAKLGDPSDRRFVGLAGARGLVERGDSRLAYRTVGGGTSNNWIVVAVAPRVGGLSVVPIAAVLLGLLGLALLMGHRWTRTSRHAETDSLTGLGNRRKLGVDLARLLSGADESSPLTLCAYDLNGFENYNDSFGHPAGDALLGRFGARLATAAPAATATASGGDEFCVLIVADRAPSTRSSPPRSRRSPTTARAGGSTARTARWTCRPRRATSRAPCGSPTSVCTRRSRAADARRAARAPTCSCRRCSSATPTSARICTTSEISPRPSVRIRARDGGPRHAPPRRGAARHRQGRDPGRDHVQARPARPGRMGDRSSAHDHRRENPRCSAGAHPGRQARPLEPRATRRHGLPGRHRRQTRFRSARASWPSATPSTP